MVFHLIIMENVSVYIHIPFCLQKCLYCDFYSVVADEKIMEQYVDNLIVEIKLRASLLRGRTLLVKSIYFGGGTPSLLPIDGIARILSTVYDNFSVSSTAENSIEINPETAKLSLFREFLALGLNRFSIGIQSFSDKDLRKLGRIHDAATGSEAILNAIASGCQNINIDLIYAVPDQTLQEWRENLDIAADQNCEHLSIYGMTIEPGTPLAAMVHDRSIVPADEDLEREMYLVTMEHLESRGYQHYEISNYALPGFVCQHNMTYWDGGNYLGFGAAAHSYWRDERSCNDSDVMTYIDRLRLGKLPVVSTETLSVEQKYIEHIMLGFRKTEGFSLREFSEKFGYDFLDKHRDQVTLLLQGDEPFLSIDQDRIKLTREGLLVYNEICRSFI